MRRVFPQPLKPCRRRPINSGLQPLRDVLRQAESIDATRPGMALVSAREFPAAGLGVGVVNGLARVSRPASQSWASAQGRHGVACSNRTVASLENFRLVVFREVAEELSFRKAAEELYLTQPAVSLQIKALEEDLGVQLFDRTGKAVALTAAGRILLDTQSRAANCCSRPSGRLRRWMEPTPGIWRWVLRPPSRNTCCRACSVNFARPTRACIPR